MRRSGVRVLGVLGACLAIAGTTIPAGAAPNAVDLELNIGAATTNSRPVLLPKGATANLTSSTSR